PRGRDPDVDRPGRLGGRDGGDLRRRLHREAGGGRAAEADRGRAAEVRPGDGHRGATRLRAGFRSDLRDRRRGHVGESVGGGSDRRAPHRGDGDVDGPGGPGRRGGRDRAGGGDGEGGGGLAPEGDPRRPAEIRPADRHRRAAGRGAGGRTDPGDRRGRHVGELVGRRGRRRAV